MGMCAADGVLLQSIQDKLRKLYAESCTCNGTSLTSATQLLLLQACSPPPQVTRLRSELASPELAEAVGGGIPPLHTPTRQLLFWDFCEALVRIAHLKFRHLPSMQQRLHQLLHTLILPHAIKVSLWYCFAWNAEAARACRVTTRYPACTAPKRPRAC